MTRLCLILISSMIFIGCANDVAPPAPYGVIPNASQLAWHEMEMYGLIHYGVDTYTNKEWGYGDEDPALINPTGFNAEQIVNAAKAASLKGVIVVAKHHDGLCLWPSKTTTHTISLSPWKDGKGDMVQEYRQACDKLGMKLGVYCSPWDRNSSKYGSHDYVLMYREQLKELYSNYGELFISWHDGANGGDGYYGGANEKRNIDRTTYYGWDTTFTFTRKMQPSAVIFGDIGPDIRWVGNEEGFAGETSWATFTPEAPDKGKQPSNGYSKYWLATDGTKDGKYWMPAECDVPLRPGWFYHPEQDNQVKSAYTLLDLYYKSVGRGASLDLGLAPNREGILHANDVKSLTAFGDLLKKTFSRNLARGASFEASNVRRNDQDKYGVSFLTDEDRYSYWSTDDQVHNPELMINLTSSTTFNVIRLRENIKLGQRINAFAIDIWEHENWKEIANGTTVGANRLIRLPGNINASKLRLRITGSAACIALSDFGLFKEPAYLTSPVIKKSKTSLVQITTLAPVAAIRYTLDGSEPDLSSYLYETPFELTTGGIVKAKSFETDNTHSETTVKQFGYSKQGWRIAFPYNCKDCQLENAIDENEQSIYKAEKGGAEKELVIDMGLIQPVRTITYLPRQDKSIDGVVSKYSISFSDDGKNWRNITTGEFSNVRANPVEQIIFPAKSITTRYIKFSALALLSGDAMTVAEIGVRKN